MSSDLTLAQATIGIVTALPKELAAARAVFAPCIPAAAPSGTIYELCSVPCIGGDAVVAMTLLPRMGNNFAAAVTSHMLRDCENVRDVMMVGIAGAIPCPSNADRHVRLGDIVVSGHQGIFQFDFGKQEEGKSFQHRSATTLPSAKLWNAVNRLFALLEGGERPWEEHIARASGRLADSCRPPENADILDDGDGAIAHPRDPKRRDGNPRLFVGTIGSSNTLLKDAQKRKEISDVAPDLLCCVEMEGAGVQDATWIANNAGYLVIRGTCDYCNAKKNDTWQKYAALIAAAFTRAVVEALPAPSSSSSEGTAASANAPAQRQSFGEISNSGNMTFLNVNAQELHIHVGSSGLALPHGVTLSTLLSASDEPLRAEELQLADGVKDDVQRAECVVRLGQALMTRALADHTNGRNILPHTITATEREKLAVVVETLRPVLESVRAAGKPVSGLDMAALTVAWQASHLLQRREAVEEWLTLMAQWVPVSVDVARGVVSGYIEASPDLPARLRAEHPDDLDANMLAAFIQSGSLGEHAAAFEKAKELVPLAETGAQKEELFRLLQQIRQELEGAEATECEALARSLVEHIPRLRAIFEASVTLRNGAPDRAIEILDTQKDGDDPYWLQMRANAELARENPAEAVRFLLRAAQKTFDAGLLQKTGDIAYLAKKFTVAAWCYERLVEVQPQNVPAHGNLAHIYTFVLHDLDRALVHFRVLHAGEPGNKVHTLNLAVCLAEAFHPQESLAMYNELCGGDEPSLQAVLGRAQLHHSLGHPETSLTSLESFRDRFWDTPRFVLTYMSTAYAAGRDDAAHEAMKALNELREKGVVKPEVVQTVPNEEALEMFKQSFKQAQDRNEHLHAEMLKGRMPWVWSEQMSKNAIYLGWRTRTQEMGWIGDEPTNRARYSIYSTNGFHARESVHGRRELRPLKSPPSGTAVVADVSALITLHRLGLLEAAAEHFGEIVVPAGYLPSVLEDSRQMVLNQRSRQQSAEQIVKLVSAGRIQVLSDGSEPSTAAPIADEYADTTEHRYRLRDVIQPVHAAGIIKDGDLARVSGTNAKPSAVDAAHPPLGQFQDVLVDLTTLETIAHAELLDAVTGFYRIQITVAGHREVVHRLDSIAYQEETRQWHMDLWKRLRGDPRFRFVPHSVPKEMRDKDSKVKDYLPFLASFVAQKLKMPILVDDRACQAFTLNEMTDVPHAAFGSNALVTALMDAGTLDGDTAGALVRQLMMWRYRFIVPGPRFLKTLADQYRMHLPGVALRDVAAYVHDCMSDPGLFAGPEKTDMGDSMALRLYLTWMSTIAEFLILVWDDENYAPEAAERLTMWCCEELLPSIPRGVDGRTRARVGEKAAQVFLGDALLNMVNRIGEPRMADAMKAIKEGLRLTDDEYQRIVMGILNDTARTAPDA